MFKSIFLFESIVILKHSYDSIKTTSLDTIIKYMIWPQNQQKKTSKAIKLWSKQNI